MLRETTTVPSRLMMRLGAVASTGVVVTGCGTTAGGWVACGATCVGAGAGSVATARGGSGLAVSTVGGGGAGAVLGVLAASWVAGAGAFSSISAATKA